MVSPEVIWTNTLFLSAPIHNHQDRGIALKVVQYFSKIRRTVWILIIRVWINYLLIRLNFILHWIHWYCISKPLENCINVSLQPLSSIQTHSLSCALNLGPKSSSYLFMIRSSRRLFWVLAHSMSNFQILILNSQARQIL